MPARTRKPKEQKPRTRKPKEPKIPKEKQKIKLFKTLLEDDDFEWIDYPFKSKISKLNPDNFIYNPKINHEPFAHDYKLKPCLKFAKPDFSPEPGCWEVDLMFVNYVDWENGEAIIEMEQDEDNDNNDEDDIVEYDDDIDNLEAYKYSKESKAYLIMVNTNTRYLIVEPIENREKKAIISAYQRIFKRFDDFKFDTIKCDGEYNLTIAADKKLFGDRAVNKVIVDSSKYTLSHKIVDATIRTLRNAFGLNPKKMGIPLLMQQMVHYYNNTPHTSLKFRNYKYFGDVELDKYLAREPKWIYYTPNQMQHNPDLEWQYIRQMKLVLRRIQDKQRMKGLLSYKPGNIIMIHLDFGKTEKRFEKQRRNFNELAVFVKYENGNVVCKLMNPYHRFIKNKDGTYETLSKTDTYKEFTENTNKKYNIIKDGENHDKRVLVRVPIMYTKFVASNYNLLSEEYKDYFIV